MGYTLTPDRDVVLHTAVAAELQTLAARSTTPSRRPHRGVRPAPPSSSSRERPTFSR